MVVNSSKSSSMGMLLLRDLRTGLRRGQCWRVLLLLVEMVMAGRHEGASSRKTTLPVAIVT